MSLEKFSNKLGVYILKDKTDKPIYIGKALNIKGRLKSHFRSTNVKEKSLVSRTSKINTILVESEIEALILEANLIKKFKPIFNTSLKDDKDYLYIKIPKEPFPRVLVARKRDLKNSKIYFGPFPSTSSVRTTLRKLRKIFPFRFCRIGQKRACLSFHLGLCPGACIGKINEENYLKNISNLIKFLKGQKEELLRKLDNQMQKASKKMEFEEAKKIKQTIDALHYVTLSRSDIGDYLKNGTLGKDLRTFGLEELKEVLHLPKIPGKIEAYDISNFAGKENVGSMVVFVDGKPEKSLYRRFKIREVEGINDYASLEEVLERRLHNTRSDASFSQLPNLIVIDGGKGQLGVAVKILENLNLKIPAIALAKKEEKIFMPNRPTSLKLKLDSASLYLIQRLRDEAHRFAISYHRLLRRKYFIPRVEKTSLREVKIININEKTN